MPKPLWNGVTASTITPFAADGSLAAGADACTHRLDHRRRRARHFAAGQLGRVSGLGTRRPQTCPRSCTGSQQRPRAGGGGHACYSTQHTIELSKHAQKAGADALLIVPPFYMSPTISQTMDHYRRIAESVGIPVVLYHNVPLTNIDLRTSHLLKLFEERRDRGRQNVEPRA